MSDNDVIVAYRALTLSFYKVVLLNTSVFLNNSLFSRDFKLAWNQSDLTIYLI